MEENIKEEKKMNCNEIVVPEQQSKKEPSAVTPEIVKSDVQATSPSSSQQRRIKPETTVSLDKEEEVLSDLEEKNTIVNTSAEDQPVSVRADPENVQTDSSDDDSSYFADPSHLPEPKSGRRYSWSSTASNNNNNNNANIVQPNSKESDASLSLSDDSDDQQQHPYQQRPPMDSSAAMQYHIYQQQQQMYQQHAFQQQQAAMAQYQQQQQTMYGNAAAAAAAAVTTAGLPDVYPERIVRRHSVSSLVSTSDQNSSDSSVQDELQNVTKGQQKRSGSAIPSGRRSPVLGGHNPPFFASPSSMHGPSPPTIMQTYPPHGNFLHPQPVAGLQHQQQNWRINSSGSAQDSELAYSINSGDEANQQQKAISKDKKDRQLSFADDTSSHHNHDGQGFKVYWRRWIMLMYMSVLNLLSDWTCYSVAPIAVLTEEAFGNIDPELLVVVFLCANGIATACEPIILARLGLRKTVLLGALLLMLGSIVKSGGMPPIIASNLEKGHGEWQVYFGFFLVGLSQPLYQCTPALLSASWFPERERTMATGVALNSNQLGIGFAFIFGTLLVEAPDDIPKYFGLLSIISTLTFLGTLIQFDDAPPTPPSDTARVMRGTLEMKLPNVRTIFDSVRGLTAPQTAQSDNKAQPKETETDQAKQEFKSRQSAAGEDSGNRPSSSNSRRRRSRSEKKSSSNRRGSGSGARRRSNNKVKSATEEIGFAPSPSPARFHAIGKSYPAPSPMMPGTVGKSNNNDEEKQQISGPPQQVPPFAGYPAQPGMPPPGYVDAQGAPYYPQYPPPYAMQYWDPQYQQYMQAQQQMYAQGYAFPPPDPLYGYGYYSYQHSMPPPPLHMRGYEPAERVLPSAAAIDEGAEPVLTLTPHHVDINIRDDQIWLSTKACYARAGFVHSLVCFTVSGIVINTLSTFMDYLVRLNGAGREYTGIVGGAFQFAIMISSLLIGKVCDKTRAYYSIAIGMLVLGAFGLAECGVSLDADRGSTLRWSLVVVAILVGPLQPVSTELGVEVVYPLSENTVLVIQQLFSNLLSALFIPCFKALKDVGAGSLTENFTEKPEYTFSFYLLIVLHAAATVFFATFSGRYLRYEREQEKKAVEESRKNAEAKRAFRRIPRDHSPVSHGSEQMPLL